MKGSLLLPYLSICKLLWMLLSMQVQEALNTFNKAVTGLRRNTDKSVYYLSSFCNLYSPYNYWLLFRCLFLLKICHRRYWWMTECAFRVLFVCACTAESEWWWHLLLIVWKKYKDFFSLETDWVLHDWICVCLCVTKHTTSSMSFQCHFSMSWDVFS